MISKRARRAKRPIAGARGIGSGVAAMGIAFAIEIGRAHV